MTRHCHAIMPQLLAFWILRAFSVSPSQKDRREQEKIQKGARGVHGQGAAKADWNSSGQQRDGETLVSTKKHQISLAMACPKHS